MVNFQQKKYHKALSTPRQHGPEKEVNSTPEKTAN
jgi:hypothetical protein